MIYIMTYITITKIFSRIMIITMIKFMRDTKNTSITNIIIELYIVIYHNYISLIDILLLKYYDNIK